MSMKRNVVSSGNPSHRRHQKRVRRDEMVSSADTTTAVNDDPSSDGTSLTDSFDEQDETILQDYGEFSAFLTKGNLDLSKKPHPSPLQSTRLKRSSEPPLHTDNTRPSEEEHTLSKSKSRKSIIPMRSSMATIEQDYERRLKKSKTISSDEDETITKLPIKTAQGRVVAFYSNVPDEISSETSDEDISEGEHSKAKLDLADSIHRNDGGSFIQSNPVSDIGRKQEEIASISQNLLENPQEHIDSIQLLLKYSSDQVTTVRKWALISLLSIFKDLLPGYQIRIPTQKENQAKVSKEVQALRLYETRLLKKYHAYVNLLHEYIKEGQRKSNPKDMKADTVSDWTSKPSYEISLVSMKCLCDLFMGASHFNLNTEILTILIPQMNVVLPREFFSWIYQALEYVLERDMSGTISLSIVRAISNFILSKNYLVRSDILQLFTKLKFLDDMELPSPESTKEPHGKKDKKAYIPKQQRKLLKKDKALAKELKEAEAELTKKDKVKKQADILKAIFVVYFRVLKHVKKSSLLSIALEGLSRFAPFINVDYVIDLIQILKELIHREDLSPRNSLDCTYAALWILSDKNDFLNLDPREFYQQLYRSMLHFELYTHESSLDLILKSLEFSFLKKKHPSLHRVAAFLKRLTLMSLHLSYYPSARCLALISQFFQKYPMLDRLLENDIIGNEVCHADGDDPDLCQPFASCFWELLPILNRQEPLIVETVHSLLKKTPISCLGLDRWYQSLRNSLEIRVPTKALTTSRRKSNSIVTFSTPFLDSLLKSYLD